MEKETLYHLSNDYILSPLKFGDSFLVQVGRRYCKPSEVIRAHAHVGFYELTVVGGGKGEVSANGEKKPVRSGDIFVSLPFDVHEIKSDAVSGLEYDFISFYTENEKINDEFEEIVKQSGSGENRIIRDEKIELLVKNVITEFSAQDSPFFSETVTNNLSLLLIYLSRDLKHEKSVTLNKSESEVLCYQIMNYVDTHLNTLSVLEEIADKFGYNYRYLSGVFKKTTGKTLSEYYHRRVLETAKALVLENKKKIGEIAETFGYTPYSFSKAFKKEFGTSPKALQKTD